MIEKTNAYHRKVALTRCADYTQPGIGEAIARQFELLGGLGKFVSRGDRVLLKPNLITPKSKRCATQTDPAVILEVARLLKDFGARPFVGDSPAWGNVFTCIKKLKIEDDLKRLGVAVKQLDKPKKCVIGKNRTKVGISTVALDADVIINLPKFKSHQQLVATFAIKNMFGCVSGKQKAYWHFAKGGNEDDFCRLLIDIFEFLKPAITMIDGVVAMEGPGPISGKPRRLGWLIGGAEPLSCEAVCARLININPETLPIVRTALQGNYGCLDIGKIEIVGDRLENICTDFEPAEPIQLRFSLLRICKSISKQILLLARSPIKRKDRR